MRLIIATIHDYDAAGVLRDLSERGIGATQIASTGRALSTGATTLLIGVPRAQVPRVLRVLDEHCRTAVEAVLPEPGGEEENWYPPPMVTTGSGGAVVSVVRVVRFEQF